MGKRLALNFPKRSERRRAISNINLNKTEKKTICVEIENHEDQQVGGWWWWGHAKIPDPYMVGGW